MWSKDQSFVMLPPTMVLLNRLQFGFYSVQGAARRELSTTRRWNDDFSGEAGLLDAIGDASAQLHVKGPGASIARVLVQTDAAFAVRTATTVLPPLAGVRTP